MDQTYGTDYTSLYQRHWWWRSRERILTRVIRSLKLAHPAEILDFGCGNGLFLSRLHEFGKVRGIEVDEHLLDENGPYRSRISTQPLGSQQYADWKFDLITACDVLEHIEDDGEAIRQLVAMLRPRGYLLVTVPAFRLLWDYHDEMNHHYRRYRVKQVMELLPSTLKLIQCRYLFHSIFVPKLAFKLVNSRRQQKMVQHRVPGAVVNQAMETWCYAEYRLTESWRPPFGTSVLAIAQRADSNSIEEQ